MSNYRVRKNYKIVDDFAELSHCWNWEIDNDLFFVYSNSRATTFLEFTTDEITSKNLLDIVSPKDRNELLSLFRDITFKNSSIAHFKHRKISKSGKEIWTIANITELKDNNNTIGYRGSEINVSDSVACRNELKELAEVQTDIANIVFEAIVIHKNGIVQDCNDVFFNMTEY